MVRKIVFSFVASDGWEIVCSSWRPHNPPRAIVLIAHGMGEHIDRYSVTAEFLSNQDIAVFGNDQRGHGRTALRCGEFGDWGNPGMQGVIDDIAELSQIAKASVAGVPLIVLGHGIGSLAALAYAVAHSSDMAALALSGSGALDHLLRNIAESGSRPDQYFNAPFEPVRTSFDWLSRDPAAVDAFQRDPLCFGWLDATMLGQISTAVTYLSNPSCLQQIRPSLPVYLMSGGVDPIGQRLEGVRLLKQRLGAAGLRSIEHHF